MPAIRPDVISDCISLSDKGRGSVLGLISKHGAVDAVLSAVVDELAPDEQSVSIASSKSDDLAGADELASLASICIPPCRVVPFVQVETGAIPVFRQIPERCHGSDSRDLAVRLVIPVLPWRGWRRRCFEKPFQMRRAGL